MPGSRALNGVLVLDKPVGCSSNQALQRVKRLYSAAKAGHTGSLDPMASGVLPIFFGQLTRLTRFLLDADKSYRGVACFGASTTTGDVEGDYVECGDTSHLTARMVERAMSALRGPLIQYPPAFSAVKVGGQPLYRMARRGVHVKRPARRVTIHSVELLGFNPGHRASAEIAISCSKGTYIRSWVSDLGRELGCGAYLSGLRRTRAGRYDIADAVAMDTLTGLATTGKHTELDALLISAHDDPVSHLPIVHVDRDEAIQLRHGMQINCRSEGRDMVRVRTGMQEFVGIGRFVQDDLLAPHTMFNLTQSSSTNGVVL